jgi:hypothetical protein
MDFIDGQIDQLKNEREQLEAKTREDKKAFVAKLLDSDDIKKELSEHSNYYNDALIKMNEEVVLLDRKEEEKKHKGFFDRLLELL